MDESSQPQIRDAGKGKGSEKLEEINQSFKERDIRQKAKDIGVNYVDLQNIPLQQEALELMNWKSVEANQSVPFEVRGKELRVACVNPGSEECQKIVEGFEKQGFQVEKYICSPEGLHSTKSHYEGHTKRKEIEIKTDIQEGELMNKVNTVFEKEAELFSKGTGPEMMNHLNLLAIQFKASDVHFQPSEKVVHIRMRRDGQLYDVYEMSHKQYLLLSGELKRAAKMKANVKNVPQDGDYEFMANERKISVRASSLPSKYGESLVLRILDAEHAIVELDQLGFSEENKDIIIKHLNKERGLILVTGPTGSGKTSTLYSCLNYANKPEKKIITLEDPIEFELEHTIQSEIEDDVGYSFANGLRAILRQDPDVVMVGEIRDKDAAEIALQASLTGHLVLSTVHANDAISTIPRLFNMGLKAYILAAGLEVIIAQRLVRKLCENCKQAGEIDEAIQKDIDEAMAILNKQGVELPEKKIFTAKGCDKCANTGYEGRVAIAEVLSISEGIRKAILSQSPISEIFKIAQEEGFLSLREDGILKVLEGKTTLEEVWRVLI